MGGGRGSLAFPDREEEVGGRDEEGEDEEEMDVLDARKKSSSSLSSKTEGEICFLGCGRGCEEKQGEGEGSLGC